MSDYRDRWPVEVGFVPAAMLMAGAIGVWIAAMLAVGRGALPGWSLVPVALALLLAFALVARGAARSARARADVLASWRGRVVCGVELRSEPDGSCTLTLELVEGGERDGGGELLRFHGVRRAQLRQSGDDLLRFDGLRCEPLGSRRRDGLRFEVRDVWDDRLRFRCRSFGALLVPGNGSAG